MERIQRIIKRSNLALWASLLIAISLIFGASCTKDDKVGEPTISNIRFVDPSIEDQDIASAGLDQWIAIQGNNLATTTNIHMNNHEVWFNPTYVTNSNILVQISDEVPTLATAPDLADNQITVITEGGVASYDFMVLPPPPILDSVSNEFARPGDEITLYGRYFYFVEEVIFPGEVSTTEFTTVDGRTMKVVVPDDFDAEGGLITIISESGEGSHGDRARFHDRTGMLIDFNPEPELYWGITDRSDPYIKNGTIYPEIPSINGNYLHYVLKDLSPSSWWIGVSAVPFQPEILDYPDDIEDDTPLANLELIFEMYVVDYWESGFIEFIIDFENEGPRYNYQPQQWMVDGDRNRYTGNQWRTVSLPLRKWTEVPGYSVYGDVKNTILFFNFKNGEEPEHTSIPGLEMAFDNFRIVRSM